MSSDALWEKFMASGAVADYLKYKEILNDNTKRSDPA